MPDVYDPAAYAVGQLLGEGVPASSGDGILFDSLCHAGGTNVVAYRSRRVVDVTQVDRHEIEVRAVDNRIDAHRLTI